MTRTKYIHHSKWFYGNQISDYGLENGFVDYRTLAMSFDAVMANDIIRNTSEIGCWELYSGEECDEDGNYCEVFQCYIVSGSGAQILSELTNEIVYYNEELDMYVWGVCHWGTPWDYVLTDIKIDLEGEI